MQNVSRELTEEVLDIRQRGSADGLPRGAEQQVHREP